METNNDNDNKSTIDSLQMSEEDLLKSIFESSNRGINFNAPVSIARTLPYFSSLLIKLSRQAEDSTKRVVKLTKQLYYLTWILAILAAITLFIGFLSLTKKPVITYLKPHQKNEQARQHNNIDQVGKVIHGINYK